MLVLYSATVFLSAFLIFLVQPMIGKMILPLVGGAPAAWNSCLFFFQALMLAGYAYAHFSLRRLGLSRQAMTHFAMMLVALFLLPISFDRNVAVPENPSLWLIGKLFTSAGLPFFVLAALSPLLQTWFSRSGHARAENPYFLFAASNLGSFAALLLYPTLVEARFGLSIQTKIWAGGFALLLILLVTCRLCVKSAATVEGADDTPVSETADNRIKWLIAAMIPSVLLLAVTQFITADLAPIPLLWVIPLAIYLITYVMAFSSHNLAPAKIEMLFLLAILLFPVAYFKLHRSLAAALSTHLFILFAISLYCHSYLAACRPKAKNLTGYYTVMSLGSVIGSLAVTFIAPLMFSNDAEYPLAIIFACFMTKRFRFSDNGENPDEKESLALSVIIGLYAASALVAIENINFSRNLQQTAHSMGFDPGSGYLNSMIHFLAARQLETTMLLLLIAAVLPLFIVKKMPRLNLALFSLISVGMLAINYAGTMPLRLHSSRNFFGIKKVTVASENNTIAMVHGSTMHGMQSLLLDKMFEPLAYFHKNGPIGSIFALKLTRKPDFKAGILGLGIGSLLAYAKPGQEFTFYEIDPEVIKIAQNPDYFSYLSSFKDRARVICGDGRRMIEQSPNGYFDAIFADAFSSDSIPVHLATEEALKIYADRLQPEGIIVFNISNRYIDLKPVLAALAHKADFIALHVLDNVFVKDDPANFGRNVSEYVVLTKSADIADGLIKSPILAWNKLTDHTVSDRGTAAARWTDNSSSLFPLFKIFR
ncbi:MAG: fused MFS/spermidine synthase [Candidatus Riflebacteria bacterium]|nr:fused MFS/spermidine synthase [Candidatus Riflebacteria bacterium]